MAKSVLLISNRPDDAIFAGEVALQAGLSIQTAAEPKQGLEIILGDHPEVILVDASEQKNYAKFEQVIQDSVGLFSDRIQSGSIHFLTSHSIEKVPYIVQSPLFSHLITRKEGVEKDSGARYGRVIQALNSKPTTGLAGMLGPQAKVQLVQLQSSQQKGEAVEAVKNFAQKAKFHPRMATVLATAVDELIMNAIFDAPIDDLGRPLYKVTSRSSTIKLEGKSKVEMKVGFDGETLGVSVTDFYGSLEKSALLNHISKIYTKEDYKVKASVAGAGLGLATVFHSGGSLLFSSESRVRTDVTVLFQRHDSFKEFKEQFRFLSTQFSF